MPQRNQKSLPSRKIDSAEQRTTQLGMANPPRNLQIQHSSAGSEFARLNDFNGVVLEV